MVQRITTRYLTDRYGGPSERFWERRRAAMVELGLLARLGRSFYGDPDEIDRAVMDGRIEQATVRESEAA
jgi:hypothetical protein